MRENLRIADIVRHLFASLAGANTSVFEPPNDRQMIKMLTASEVGAESVVRKGRIKLSLPYFGWYSVEIDGLTGRKPCCQLSECSPSYFGPITTTMMPPDCEVVVVMDPKEQWGYIIGSKPTIVQDGNYCFSDFVFQGSGTGFQDKYCSSYINNTKDSGGVVDFSNNRPLDNLITDWGVATVTGAMLHLDPFMTFMRVNESTGLWCFYPDGHTRLAGQSLEFVSDSSHSESGIDAGETFTYYGEAMYPWEAMGVADPAATVTRTVEDTEIHKTHLEGKYEPVYADQQAIFRYEEYGGYLANGRMRQMSLPAALNNEVESATTRLSDEAVATCVFREHIGIDGAYSLASAKSVRITKQTLIPSFKRIKARNDGADNADTPETYNASGWFNDDDALKHKIGDLSDADCTKTVSQAIDRLAYDCNQKHVFGVGMHAGDFSLPEAADNAFASWQDALNFDSLKNSTRIDTVEPEQLTLDHRMQAKFYRLLQMLEFADDGSVILQGGYGERIVFARGEIFIDAPGNINIRPGKSAVVLAGDDAIIRARNSFDITASYKDGRIAAARNLHTLSGSSGYGGTLVENRATSKDQSFPSIGGEAVESSGIVLKSAQSLVSAIAGEIYLRTGSSSGGVSTGNIVLDADNGSADIVALASKHKRFIKSSTTDSFGENPDNITAVNMSSATGSFNSTDMVVDGSVTVSGSMTLRLGLTITAGHVSSSSGGDVGRIGPDRDRTFQFVSARSRGYVEESNKSYDSYRRDYYGINKIGAADTQKKISFGCRTESDYGTKNWETPEAYWQQLAKGSGAVTIWQEPPIKYQGGTNTYAWPGACWLKDRLATFSSSSSSFFDSQQNRPKDREFTETPEYKGLELKAPQTNYLVINC